jgi:aminoglycoside phosphotransferase (APT) family kinase protein
VHRDQLELDPAVARRLIDDQFPQWADLPVRLLTTSGTVNTIVRIGTGLAARFPLQGSDPEQVGRTLERENQAARWFHRSSPVPSPEPVGIGRPGRGYPLPWSVQTWVPGDVVTGTSHAASVAFAGDLAALIATLRATDTGGATFTGDGRGGDIAAHDDWVAECLEMSEHLLDVPLLESLWARFRALPRTGPDVMSHGDLTPANVVATGQRLAGILDGGGFGAADPALDLIAAWHHLDAQTRAALREVLGCDDVEWRRGMAWAFQQSIAAIWYYLDSNPTMSAMGLLTLGRVVGECRPGARPAPASSDVWAVATSSAPGSSAPGSSAPGSSAGLGWAP